ncbi:hypothetical protein CON53_21365 [Bacillus cereus]|nr:hypothetical protein CON53_21365 [Bacillus cereus]PFH93074.1 hypothetical protein COI81_04365 [Bacillus cereus]PFM54300.1 hypothetical protein COJ52_22325 [Bacillus cereus]PGS19090.1 hypothetical protein COC55_30060 [Bacillus cereus]
MEQNGHLVRRVIVKLYYVTNGYTGDDQVHVYVIAENEERAKELASEKFKEDARNESYEHDVELFQSVGRSTDGLKEYRYDERYWTNLKVYCEVEDTSKEFASDVNG